LNTETPVRRWATCPSELNPANVRPMDLAMERQHGLNAWYILYKEVSLASKAMMVISLSPLSHDHVFNIICDLLRNR
jgi:hypothetical protein